MQITFRNVDYSSDADCSLLAKWSNDIEIRHFCSPYKDDESFATPTTVASFKERHLKRKQDSTALMVILDGLPAGVVSSELYHEAKVNESSSVAWLSIILGEPHARGRGVGGIVMAHIENIARTAGATKAELGVFEFNERALALYRKLGYREFLRIPDFTYWNGKMWSDIRMEKVL